MTPSFRNNRRGLALIVILWVSAILTLLVHSFLHAMLVEYTLSTGLGAQKQAEQLAWSAVEKGMAVLAQDETVEGTLFEDWADDPDEFLEFPLGEGFFTLYRPTHDPAEDPLFGAGDEAARINLNTASRDLLMGIPDMTDEVADSILDWRDGNDEARTNGAETPWYQGQDPGYDCKNGPFETVEELFFVRGVTVDLMYGDDRNRNGVQDAFEVAAGGKFRHGIAAFLTVWSREPDIAADGNPRVDINRANEQALGQRLGEFLAPVQIQAILTYRAASGQYGSIAHLLDVPTITPEAFREIADLVTVQEEGTQWVEGRINVNTAPRPVLDAIPGLETESLELILQHRKTQGTDFSTIGWLVDILQPDDLKKIVRYLTVRSVQYRFDASGFVLPPGASRSRRPVFRRLLAVVEREASSFRLLYWKDWSGFGLSYEVTGGDIVFPEGS